MWVREGSVPYFTTLASHTLGMALLVGGGIVISLGVLGMGRDASLAKFRGFFPVMWLGAALAIASGILLVIAYPAKALTNPVLAMKFASFIGAALLLRSLARGALPAAARGGPLPRGSRVIAALALVLWLGGVAAGKLLLYTYDVLRAS